MTKRTTVTLSIIFALIAAVLAFSAATIEYVRHGRIKLMPILGTLFMLALAYWLSQSRNSGDSK